jgi:hypothetical protein
MCPGIAQIANFRRVTGGERLPAPTKAHRGHFFVQRERKLFEIDSEEQPNSSGGGGGDCQRCCRPFFF